MDWKRHLIGGFVIGAIFAYLAYGFFTVDIQTVILGAVLIIIFSILPDCDHDASKINNVLEILSAVLVGWGFFGKILVDWLVSHNVITQTLADIICPPRLLLFGVVMLILTVSAAHGATHRGWIHSIPAGAIFAFLASLLLFKFGAQTLFLGALAFVAYWSHLLCDGIPFKMGGKS